MSRYLAAGDGQARGIGLQPPAPDDAIAWDAAVQRADLLAYRPRRQQFFTEGYREDGGDRNAKHIRQHVAVQRSTECIGAKNDKID
ncbi:MAG: hypothetical protein V4653_00685 [Pseudomonadota bacterium]